MSFHRPVFAWPALSALLLLAAIPQSVRAISFTAFDARSLAMGGTGVATARPYNAILFNPAMLVNGSATPKQIFVRPYLGLRLIDRDNFIDSLEDFQDRGGNDRLNSAVDNFEATNARFDEDQAEADNLLAAAQAVTREAGILFADLQSLSNKPLRIAASAGGSFGQADRNIGYAGSIRTTRIGGSVINLSAADTSRVANNIDTTARFIDELERLLPANPTDAQVAALYDRWAEDFQSNDGELSSAYEFTGASATEIAFAHARRWPGREAWSVGVTVKRIEFTTIDYVEPIDETELADVDESRFQKKYTDLNLDLGVAVDFYRDSRLGFVLRNLVRRNYRTVRGRAIKLRPQARMGVAWEPGPYTLTADLDLTTTDPLGYDPDQRFVATGAEWRLLGNIALRAGYRYNTIDSSDLWSLGVGIGPRQAHADIAFAARGDELGAALQLAIYF